MYCYVFFGESKDQHTRHYLYESKEAIELGDVVVVPAKNATKLALVHSLFETIPTDIAIKDKKIRSIISISNDPVNGKLIRSFLLAMIDEYKDGIVSREKFNEIMEHLLFMSMSQDRNRRKNWDSGKKSKIWNID